MSWFKNWIEANGHPPTVPNCIWDSPNPYQSLYDLGIWHYNAEASDALAKVHSVINCAIPTRDSILYGLGFSLMAKEKFPRSWGAYYSFEMLKALEADSQIRISSILEAVSALKSPNVTIATSIAREAYNLLVDTHDQDLNKIVFSPLIESSFDNKRKDIINGCLDPNIFDNTQSSGKDRSSEILCFYGNCNKTIRNPYSEWNSLDALPKARLAEIVNAIKISLLSKEGFSLIRLGDGEGLFACKERSDIGGATQNGRIVLTESHHGKGHLDSQEYDFILDKFRSSIVESDIIGIPDLQQVIYGPRDLSKVPLALIEFKQHLSIDDMREHIVIGGWHMHNYFLYHGLFSQAPFNQPDAIIGPSIPKNLLKNNSLKWMKIPGEYKFRETDSIYAHYPVFYNQTLEWISCNINKGDLVYVGAGILGKIYCHEVKKQGGVAIDIGSILDVASNCLTTRGEYRANPYSCKLAEAAFA